MRYLLIASLILFSFSCGVRDIHRPAVSSYTGSVKINGQKLTSSGIDIKYNDKIETEAKSHCDIIINKNPGLLYHDDSGVEKLAALINEKIDWTRPDSN